jgi:archaeosine synthase beta-subunit
MGEYPAETRARDRWILERRPRRTSADPDRPHGYLVETERAESGEIVTTATLFLTNRECPWRCLMCDLWKATVTQTVPVGAIPRQIDYAFEKLGFKPEVNPKSEIRGPKVDLKSEGMGERSAGRSVVPTPSATPRQIKLYNGGSFFDPQAIPPADYSAIAQRVCHFERVIVECHPGFVRDSCLKFRDALARGSPAPPQLEVAMGLETVHPEVLAKLNKRMTLDQFTRAAEFLKHHGIALRAFVLVKPPFLDEVAGLYWAERSVDFAFDVNASVVSLIPTRGGNGALEALQRLSQFSPPKLSTLESAQAYGIRLGRGRVFADLWDLETFSDCPQCFGARRDRLHRMNLEQVPLAAVPCPACDVALAGGSGLP